MNAHNVCGNPIHGSTETAKSSVHDDEVSPSYNRSSLIFESPRKALDQIEQTFTTRRDMGAVLDVVR